MLDSPCVALLHEGRVVYIPWKPSCLALSCYMITQCSNLFQRFEAQLVVLVIHLYLFTRSQRYIPNNVLYWGCRPEERVISPQPACVIGSLLSQAVVDNYTLIAPLRPTASLKGCKTIYRVEGGKAKSRKADCDRY